MNLRTSIHNNAALDNKWTILFAYLSTDLILKFCNKQNEALQISRIGWIA